MEEYLKRKLEEINNQIEITKKDMEDNLKLSQYTSLLLNTFLIDCLEAQAELIVETLKKGYK